MWQNSAYDEIPGIRGRVDSDIAFYDFPTIIREHNLNHLNNNLRYRVGDKLYATGNIYETSEATTIIENVCDKEVTIEEVIPDTEAPYKTEYGYIKENSLYTKN